MDELKPKKSFFSIIEEYQEILNNIEELDGELTEELERQMDITAEDAAEKFVAYRFKIQELAKDVEIYKSYMAEFAAKAKKAEKLSDKLKEIVLVGLTTFGEPAYDKKTGRFKNFVYETDKIKVLNVYTKPVAVDDEELIPAEFKTANVVLNSKNLEQVPKEIILKKNVEISKTAIKEAIIAGTEVPGAHIDDTASYVRFY